MVTEYRETIGSGGDIPDLATWEAATDNNLVSLDERRIAVLLAADSPHDMPAYWIIGGATVDATRYRAIEGQNALTGHVGGGVVAQNSVAYYFARVGESFFRWKNLEFDGEGTGLGVMTGTGSTGDLEGWMVDNALIYDMNGAALGSPPNPSHSNPVLTVTNVAAFNVTQMTQGTAGKEAQFVCRYCTCVRQQTDADYGGTCGRYLTFLNSCGFHFGGLSGFKDFTNIGAGSSNNACHDASSVEIQNLVAADEFSSIADHDMYLMPVPTSNLIEAGAPIAGVTTDMLGTARDPSIPDIGPFETAIPDPSYGTAEAAGEPGYAQGVATVGMVGTFADTLRIEYGGVEVENLVAVGVPPGVMVINAAARNGTGTGRILTNAAGNGLQWRAPGSSTYGTAVTTSADGDYLLRDGEDTNKFVRVHVWTSYLIANAWSEVKLRDNYNNAIASDDVDASEASAGDIETHTFVLRNAGTKTAESILAWIDASVSGIEISDDGATWVSPTDAASGLSLDDMDPGDTQTVYVRRTISASADSDDEVLNLLHFRFDLST